MAFFKLPTELKLEVFEHLCTDDELKSSASRSTKRPRMSAVALSSTCQELRAAAVNHLAIFKIARFNSPEKFTKTVINRRLWAFEENLELGKMIRDLRFHPENAEYYKQTGEERRHHPNEARPRFNDCPRLLQCFESFPNLVHLSISIPNKQGGDFKKMFQSASSPLFPKVTFLGTCVDGIFINELCPALTTHQLALDHWSYIYPDEISDKFLKWLEQLVRAPKMTTLVLPRLYFRMYPWMLELLSLRLPNLQELDFGGTRMVIPLRQMVEIFSRFDGLETLVLSDMCSIGFNAGLHSPDPDDEGSVLPEKHWYTEKMASDAIERLLFAEYKPLREVRFNIDDNT